MLIDEDTLTNPQVMAGTPPAIPVRPRPAEQVLTGYWYVERTTRPLDVDTCAGIQAKAQEFNTFLQFHIRTLADEGPIPKLSARAQAGMQGDLTARTERFMTGTYIRPTGALMTTPYHGTDRRFFRNCVEGHPENVNEATTVYFWELDSESDRAYVRPREDGSISVTSMSRRGDGVRKITLPVVNNETARLPDYGTRYLNDEVNAFTLVLGLEPGAEYDAHTSSHHRPIPWKVTIKFGEVEVTLEEGRPEVTIRLNNQAYNIAITPGPSSRTRTDAGLRSYELTFIPVWNGMLFSDSSPASANWSDRVTYIKKDLRKTVFREYETAFHANTSQTTPSVPRFGVNGASLPVPGALGTFTPTVDPDAWANASATGKKGCFLPSSSDVKVDFGLSVEVEFERCGGTVRFIPVFFTKCIRSYLFQRGEHRTQNDIDNNRVCPDWPNVRNQFPVPVYHYQGNDVTSNLPYMWIQEQSDPAHVLAYETERETWGYRRPVEIWGYVLVLSQATEEQAAPVDQTDQVWEDEDFPDAGETDLVLPGDSGNTSVEVVPPTDMDPAEEGNVQSLQFRTAEGTLTSSDLPIARVRRVTVTRNLDGSSGSIEWDRYDYVLGLIPRPPHRVGALRLAITGGVNTVPGVIFTGIAMGNAEVDTHDANTVTIPLHGRECKMTDQEGGLRIINAPFFDANNHKDVLQWMADYVDVPFQTFARDYRLPTGTIMAPVIDIKSGTPVWDAMQEICKQGSSIVYFDRWGVLKHYDVATTTGVNWVYPVHKIETYDDKPDLTQMRDTVVVAGLVGEGEIDPQRILSPNPQNMNPDVQPMMIARTFDTVPRFPWSKMMFYALQGIVDRGRLRRAAMEIARGVTRPRATGSITIPGNASFELLDTFNTAWVIVSITHNVDLQSKNWTTQLSLEYLIGIPPVVEGGSGVTPTAGEPLILYNPISVSPGSTVPDIGTSHNSDAGIDDDVDPEDLGDF